jgi:formylmethanofuran dehydrogenase subunit A
MLNRTEFLTVINKGLVLWNLTPHGRKKFTFRRSGKHSYSATEVEAAGVAGMLVIVYQTKNEITTFRLKKGLEILRKF